MHFFYVVIWTFIIFAIIVITVLLIIKDIKKHKKE